MHQTQFARVKASSLAEAIEELDIHVERFGDRRCYATWEVARLPNGEVKVADLDPREIDSLAPEERDAAIEEDRARRERALVHWVDPDAWLRAAWVEVLATVELGLPQMFGTASEFAKMRATLDGMPTAAIPRWFVETAYAELRSLYVDCNFDVADFAAQRASARRRGLADALESVFLDMANAAEISRLPEAPFRDRQHPDLWPAHLVGSFAPIEETIFLAVDMRT